ncbi:phosphomannomutase [Roseobacter sp.]|uniref:phosphomannomutase n=1 Tax=Roseobacter sp. TaxID=1907202 RepID=UPI0025F2F137|nr:phosphomannomutase [Roseobacter sp.]
MPPKFGTSGLRGLVTELTAGLVGDYTAAFLAACDTGGVICIGRDLRPSSPQISQDVARAAVACGVTVIDCGAVPTPALALAAQARGAGAVMITGSHIPADRNGIKFYSRDGEISKSDETAINAHLGAVHTAVAPGSVETDDGAGTRFAERYLSACGKDALKGMKIGHYTHSSVGRDLISRVLRGLGAEVVELGRSESFIPVDTEAVAPDVRDMIRNWSTEHALDALVSSDGDADRPLLADETGAIVPGDILGQIVAEALRAETVVTPVSSNSGVSRKGFGKVIRTKIGSPYVIAAMQEVTDKVAGYEANGGFLLGYTAEGRAGPIAPLMTRDCVLPLVTGLIAARGGTLSQRVAQEPPVTAVADRLQDVPQAFSASFVDALAGQETARAEFLRSLGAREAALDLTDGVRITLTDGCVVHVRPSGNAPELRLYVEAENSTAAQKLLESGLAEISRRHSRWAKNAG